MMARIWTGATCVVAVSPVADLVVRNARVYTGDVPPWDR